MPCSVIATRNVTYFICKMAMRLGVSSLVEIEVDCVWEEEEGEGEEGNRR